MNPFDTESDAWAGIISLILLILIGIAANLGVIH
jgi:hypothetical protein